MQKQQMTPNTRFPLVMTMGSPTTTERLKAMPIEEIRSNFSALMDGIVTAYGDKGSGASGQKTGQETRR
jgi:hypothetical protein